MFIHQPFGAFDLHRGRGQDSPATSPRAAARRASSSSSNEPAADHGASTRGSPGFPRCRRSGRSATSSRTARSPAARRSCRVAKTFREKKLPCDTLIYLGTGFCPSGWNTAQRRVHLESGRRSPIRRRMIDELHALHFKVVLHVVIEGRHLTGTVDGSVHAPTELDAERGRLTEGTWPPDRSVGCYWPHHKPSSTSASTAGGPTRATASTRLAALRDPDVLGRAAA